MDTDNLGDEPAIVAYHRALEQRLAARKGRPPTPPPSIHLDEDLPDAPTTEAGAGQPTGDSAGVSARPAGKRRVFAFFLLVTALAVTALCFWALRGHFARSAQRGTAGCPSAICMAPFNSAKPGDTF